MCKLSVIALVAFAGVASAGFTLPGPLGDIGAKVKLGKQIVTLVPKILSAATTGNVDPELKKELEEVLKGFLSK